MSLAMELNPPSALGLAPNQLRINIGPDQRLAPPLPDRKEPLFIRFKSPTPPVVVKPLFPPRTSPVPTVPVTVRVTAPKLPSKRPRQPVPPTPIDVPLVIPETPGASTIPKVEPLTPHPTIIPSPLMETKDKRKTPPTIIKLPDFGSSISKSSGNAGSLRVPPVVRATARVPPRLEKKKTLIRVPDQPPPTPVIVRVQSPLSESADSATRSPPRRVTLRIQSPKPGVQSPPLVFARLKDPKSIDETKRTE